MTQSAKMLPFSFSSAFYSLCLCLTHQQEDLPSNTMSLSLEVSFLAQWIVPGKDALIIFTGQINFVFSGSL